MAQWYGHKRAGDGAPITFIRLGDNAAIITFAYGAGEKAGAPGVRVNKGFLEKEVANGLLSALGHENGLTLNGELLAPMLDAFMRDAKPPPVVGP